MAGESEEEEVEEPEASAEELDDDERAGLRLVRSTGGVHQSDFWKELDVSSLQGSRIAKKLADSGFIEREEVVHDGNRTYYLTPKVDRLDYSLLVAGNMISPFIGEMQPDPLSGSFTEWLYELAYDYEESA
ncbi:MAG: helix-turn-helix transcriptional regulator [Halobacteriota archaeon]